MFQFPACFRLSALLRYLRIKICMQLPEAYRSLPRLSSIPKPSYPSNSINSRYDFPHSGNLLSTFSLNITVLNWSRKFSGTISFLLSMIVIKNFLSPIYNFFNLFDSIFLTFYFPYLNGLWTKNNHGPAVNRTRTSCVQGKYLSHWTTGPYQLLLMFKLALFRF